MPRMKSKPPLKAPRYLDTLGDPAEPLDLFALHVASKKCGDVRDRLEPGIHKIDLVARIMGSLSVAESQSSVGKEAPSAKVLLGLVFEFLGPQTTEKVIRGVTAMCAPYVAGADEPEPSKIAKQHGEDLAAACSRAVQKIKAGNVTGILEARILHRTS